MCVCAQDPHLRNLESMFALQQKIVEAAIKLASEGDLCKTVRKKRRNNFLDAKRKLEEIEREINAYRIKKGKKPTQRASLILGGTHTDTHITNNHKFINAKQPTVTICKKKASIRTIPLFCYQMM